MKSLAILTLLLPSIAAADNVDGGSEPSATWSFDIGSHIRWFGDTSAAVVTTDAMPGLRMTVGRSLTSTTVKRRELDIGLFGRYVYGAASGTMFGNLDTALSQHLLGGGVRTDAPIFRWFSVVGQAELGMARTSLRVEQDAMTPADDAHWSPYLAASLGGELRLSEGKRVNVSLGVDVGYIVTVPTELHALPGDRPDEELSIATTFAGLGKLDTRGMTYSMSLRGRF